MPLTWNSGRISRHRSAGPTASAWRPISAIASRLAWSSITPLGTPVVPLVKISSASADGSTSGGPIPPRPLRVEIPDRQCRDTARSGRPVLDHQQPCAGGVELPRDLGVGQARVDRRDVAPSRHAREQQHHELDPVAQLERHHVSGTDAELVKVTTCRSNTLQQPGVGQRPSPVRHGGLGQMPVGRSSNVAPIRDGGLA